jgi:hypothetical protein
MGYNPLEKNPHHAFGVIIPHDPRHATGATTPIKGKLKQQRTFVAKIILNTFLF